MLCTSPRRAWLPINPPSGIRTLRFTPNYSRSSQEYSEIQLPCSQCLSCRIDNARQTAIRCVHEAQMHPSNSFITLTYSDEYLPNNKTLIKKDFQDFAKRLRQRIGKIVIFHCGEYGSLKGRPHFHAAIFGYDFPDKELAENSFSGKSQFSSQLLNEVWGMGRTRIGELNFASAAYIARYVTKKITGTRAKEHYNGRLPEFATFPKRPALGRTWFQTFHSDVFPHDEVIINQKPQRPPRYYTKLLEQFDPAMYKKVKTRRMLKAEAKDDPTKKQDYLTLKLLRDVMIEKFKVLKRELEL